MIETRIQGIPCLVEMTNGSYQKPYSGSAYNCETDWDYYGGWSDVEYQVYDRRGRPAPWLEKKITPKDDQEIIELLIENASD
jgi:hypothetical protein